DQTARAVLGHDLVDVGRQPDAGRHQPAAGRRVGQPAAGAVPAALSLDHRVLLHRHLFDQQLAVRCNARGLLRLIWLLADQTRLRAAAAAPRLRTATVTG